MAEKIKSVMIFEILGKPADYLKTSLDDILGKLEKERGVKINKKKIEEPKAVEDSDLFTTFAEIEVEIDGPQMFMLVLFSYMPAHVEILEPSEIRIKNFDFCNVCNELIMKLHTYDSVAKTVSIERNNLIQQINQLRGNLTVASVNQPKAKAKVEKKAKKSKKK